MRIKAMVNTDRSSQHYRGQLCYILDFDHRGRPVCAFPYDKQENDGTYKTYAKIEAMYLDNITIIDPNYIVDKSFDEWNNDDIQPR